MQTVSHLNSFTSKELNLVKVNVNITATKMMNPVTKISKKSSRIIRREEGETSTERFRTMSFRKATDDFVKDGVTILASLKDGNSLTPEIECMAAEFKDAIKGDIQSVVSPMTIKLKDNEDTTKVKIGTLDKLASILPGRQFPFYRVDRLKILYLPLFSGEEGKNKKITFSIIDTSIIEGDKAKTITQVDAPLNKMSMIELFSSYFVEKKDLSVIEFGYKAKGVPIAKRSFAFVCLSFYIQRDYIPTTIKMRSPIVFLIDDLDCPVDITKTSSIKGLVNRVNERIATDKKSFLEAREKNNRIEKGRNKSLAILVDEEEESEEESISTQKIITSNETINKSTIQGFLPRNLPIWRMDEAILDTGAPDHWIHHPDISDLELQEDRSVKMGTYHKLHGVEMKLGVHWVRMKEVLYARKDDFPLISYRKLHEGGIIDSLSSLPNNKAILCKGDQVIFHLDCSGSYMKFEKSNSLSKTVLEEK